VKISVRKYTAAIVNNLHVFKLLVDKQSKRQEKVNPTTTNRKMKSTIFLNYRKHCKLKHNKSLTLYLDKTYNTLL